MEKVARVDLCVICPGSHLPPVPDVDLGFIIILVLVLIPARTLKFNQMKARGNYPLNTIN